MLAASALQMALPGWLSLGPHWLLPALELGLLCALVTSSPGWLSAARPPCGPVAWHWPGWSSLANAISTALLVSGRPAVRQRICCPRCCWPARSGGYRFRVVVLGKLDRGGPADRRHAVRMYPDFLFPQTQQPNLAPADWKPSFTDYLYLSFMKTISFAASDVTPLTRWAKMMMMQSAVSVAAIALVVARAVNILG